MRIKPVKEFKRILTPPPDKSITIRAAIMGLLASGRTTILNPLYSGDTLAAIDSVSLLGGDVSVDKGAIVVEGGRVNGGNVDARNSATTMRLLVGALSGLNVTACVKGDASLSRRSMKSLISALSDMGAKIESKNGFAPLNVCPSVLHGIDFVPSVPSAQIKSAVLLAGLNAEGRTTVKEEIKTRTHTEDMLKSFGADIKEENGVITLNKSSLVGTEVNVPGDISSAAYPIVLALKKGFCYIKNVGTSRRELIDFLVSIGGNIEEEDMGDRANLVVKQSNLMPFNISGSLSASLIDELPLLAALACTIEGESTIMDAHSLRDKECDRIKCTVNNLRSLGASITELSDGFKISGKEIKGGNAHSYGDHRMAMSMAVANALSLSGGTVDDEQCVEISYPSFWELFV